jgi:NhaP-type Na+/H+ or K+/H+ antiporter
LLFCSLLSSSDVIAAVSLISYENEPNLYAIVFGEGITNDAVSIILFNTVMRYTARKDVKLTWVSPIQIVSEFVILGLNSLIIGVAFALFSSYILKRIRSFSKNVLFECLIVFATGYLSYLTAEISK